MNLAASHFAQKDTHTENLELATQKNVSQMPSRALWHVAREVALGKVEGLLHVVQSLELNVT